MGRLVYLMDRISSQNMPRRYLTALVCIVLVLVFAASRDLRTQRAPRGGDVACNARGCDHTATLNKYCSTCHNEKVRAGGLALDTLNPDDPGADAAAWEKVVRKLRSGAMPPAGRPRPDAATYRAVASQLEAELDAAATAPTRPRPVAAVPSSDPHGIQERDSRPARAGRSSEGCRSRSAASRRQFQQRIRQHRRSAVRLVDAARAVSVGRSEDQRCCSRRPIVPPLVDTYRMSEQFNQEYPGRGRAVRHARRHRDPHVSAAGRRVPHPRRARRRAARAASTRE